MRNNKQQNVKISEEDLARIRQIMQEEREKNKGFFEKMQDNVQQNQVSPKEAMQFVKENPEVLKLLMFLEKGGKVDSENYDMLRGKIKEVEHHAKELRGITNRKKNVPAWVLAKSTRASTDLSDITHYMDSQKFHHGGGVDYKEGEIYEINNWDADEIANYLHVPISYVVKDRQRYIREAQSYMMLNSYGNGGEISSYSVGDILKFKDGEDWRVVKVKDKFDKLVIKPHNEKAKSRNISLEIEVTSEYLKNNLINKMSEGGSIEKGAKKRLAEFFRIPINKLDEFKFDGSDDIKELSKSLNSTSDEGTKLYYDMSIQMSREDGGDYGTYTKGGGVDGISGVKRYLGLFKLNSNFKGDLVYWKKGEIVKAYESNKKGYIFVLLADENFEAYDDWSKSDFERIADPLLSGGGGVEESGLYVIGSTAFDNGKISDLIEDESLYAEWNAREGYWFFAEEVENYDNLEKMLEELFYINGVQARIEGVFGEGGGVDSKRNHLEHRLWNERGYDYKYLNSLSLKELNSLYDTEFYYDVEDDQFSEGGGIGFKALSNKVAKRYEGKSVEPKYQSEYGKRYSKSEAREVGDKVAGKVYWQQQGRKFTDGGRVGSKTKFVSIPVKEEEIYLDEKNAKSGYYNYRQILSIDSKNKTAVVIPVDFKVWYNDDAPNRIYDIRSVGNRYTEKLDYIQSVVDKRNKEEFEKNKEIESIKNKILKNLKSVSDSKYVSDLNYSHNQLALFTLLTKLKNYCNANFSAEDKKTGGQYYGSTPMYSSQRGQAVVLSFNGVHRGDYYQGSTPFIVQVQIGGALNYITKKGIELAVETILKDFKYQNDFGEGKIMKTSGTNWNSVMLTSPQSNNRYYTIPYFDDKFTDGGGVDNSNRTYKHNIYDLINKQGSYSVLYNKIKSHPAVYSFDIERMSGVFVLELELSFGLTKVYATPYFDEKLSIPIDVVEEEGDEVKYIGEIPAPNIHWTRADDFANWYYSQIDSIGDKVEEYLDKGKKYTEGGGVDNSNLSIDEYREYYSIIGRSGLGYEFNYDSKLTAYIVPESVDKLSIVKEKIENATNGKLTVVSLLKDEIIQTSGTKAGWYSTGKKTEYFKVIKKFSDKKEQGGSVSGLNDLVYG